MTGAWRVPAVGAAAGAATGLALRVLTPAALDRTAVVGRPVTLAGGPLVAAGLLAGLTAGGRRLAGGQVAVAAAAVAGLVDDLAGTGRRTARPDPGAARPDPGAARPDPGPVRGLAGHGRALLAGRVTTGQLKVALVGPGALAAAGLLRPGSRPARRLLDAVLVAGTANLVNLLDLRPGRAAKSAGAVAVALLGTPSARPPASPAGVLPVLVLAVLAVELPRDLAGGWMLGDCGANALGAALGCAVVAGHGPRVRTAWTAAVLGLTLLSERVSFSAVIARTPVLAWWDRLGRPAPVASAAR